MLSKSQRAQVVELLRCAADWCVLDRGHVWLDTVAFVVGTETAAVEYARRVGDVVSDEEPFASERAACQRDVMPNSWGLRVALEAALRVELKEWP